MPPDELELWKRYECDRDDATRNAIAERYLPLVDRIAAKMKIPRQVSRDEIHSAGCRGLLDAIRSFDRSRGFRPETHFFYRIRGEMLDDLRNLDPLPRSLRFRVKRAKALADRLGREPSIDELAAELGLERYESTQVLAHAAPAPRDPFFVPVDESNSPTIRIETAYARAYLLRGLSKTERLALGGYFFEGQTMKQIGAELGVGESRISQIVKDVLLRLRRYRNYETEREAI